MVVCTYYKKPFLIVNKLEKYLKMSNIYCNNCGKRGHSFNKCMLPITSIGIVCYREVANPSLNGDKKYEYLMICRKDSFGYIDFIRGKYPLNSITYLKNIFYEMTEKEKTSLIAYDFKSLWSNLWNGSSSSKYQVEYKKAYKKFKQLEEGIKIEDTFYTLDRFIQESNSNWKEPEWGFPKGRRNYNENDFQTAIREFCEETGFKSNMISIIRNLMPYEEVFTGSNFKSYKHKYYIAQLNSNIEYDLEHYQSSEVSKIKWCSLEECLMKIRPYNCEKVKLITNIDKMLKMTERL